MKSRLPSTRPENIIRELRRLNFTGEDISFTGLRTSGKDKLLQAGVRQFGSYKKSYRGRWH
jgi:hypothetical protein